MCLEGRHAKPWHASLCPLQLTPLLVAAACSWGLCKASGDGAKAVLRPLPCACCCAACRIGVCL